jgi:hypothetical protein
MQQQHTKITPAHTERTQEVEQDTNLGLQLLLGVVAPTSITRQQYKECYLKV